MNKKILLVLSFIFLLIAIIIGQKTVSKQIQQELAKNNQEVATTVTFTYTKDGKKVTRELTNAEANELARLMNEHDKYVKDQRLKSIFDNYFTYNSVGLKNYRGK